MNGDAVSFLNEEERIRVTELVDEGVEALKQALAVDDEYTAALQYLNLMYRERAYLAADEEDQRKWQIEADKLALRALELRKRQEEEAEACPPHLRWRRGTVAAWHSVRGLHHRLPIECDLGVAFWAALFFAGRNLGNPAVRDSRQVRSCW